MPSFHRKPNVYLGAPIFLFFKCNLILFCVTYFWRRIGRHFKEHKYNRGESNKGVTDTEKIACRNTYGSIAISRALKPNAFAIYHGSARRIDWVFWEGREN